MCGVKNCQTSTVIPTHHILENAKLVVECCAKVELPEQVVRVRSHVLCNGHTLVVCIKLEEPGGVGVYTLGSQFSGAIIVALSAILLEKVVARFEPRINTHHTHFWFFDEGAALPHWIPAH